MADRVDSDGSRLRGLADAALADEAAECRSRSLVGQGADDGGVRSFALVREAARRTLGLWAFETQILAALVLADGGVAQLPTGEGKTLAAVFAAVQSAFTGERVHIWTANDYLAQRDAAWMEPVYEMLGLRVSAASEQLTRLEKRSAYAEDVTYVAANELGFDLLRDQMARSPADRVLPPLERVIIDEIDSILIDEARIPLVLAGTVEGVVEDLDTVTDLIAGLDPLRDFETDALTRTAWLTDEGARRVEGALSVPNLYDVAHAQELDVVQRALLARAVYHRDVDYLVRGGRVELIDGTKGRVAVRRRWPDGLQEAVEAKEGLAASSRGRIRQTITLQHLARLYPSIAGMTATAESAAGELEVLYGLRVSCIPPNVACIRIDEPDRIFTHAAARDAALIDDITATHTTGRPVLVGTSSVEESEQLAERLSARDIPFELLNARHPEREAALIAQAGRLGAVTISTNMAGRGTDIVLGGTDGRDRDAVRALGGLLVLGTRRHESVRIDHQLRGRAGRQGDPGGSRFYIDLGDDTIERFGLPELLPVRYTTARLDRPIDSERVRSELERAQRICEGQLGDGRRQLARYADVIERQRWHTAELRDAVLGGERLGLLEDRAPERFAELEARIGRDVLDRVERELVVAQIDRAWPDHLERMAEVRELIPLAAVGAMPAVTDSSAGWLTPGREPPMAVYERRAHESFVAFEEAWQSGTVEIFLSAAVDEAGLDLDDHGLGEPSATWTYLLSDPPIETRAPKLVRSLRAYWVGLRAG